MTVAYSYPLMSGDSQIVQPKIRLEDVYPPQIPDEECHGELLQYLTSRLNHGNRYRTDKLTRYMSVDRVMSTWQKLTEEDTQRKGKQEATGQAQAISMNLPLIDSHVEDMVAFFSGVFSPAAGDFFQMPETQTQEKSKPLGKKLNGDAKAQKYYKNLCAMLKSLIKYNIGGVSVNWVDPDTDDTMYGDPDGQNRISSLDVYNLLWDPVIIDPADVADKAEWAATIVLRNKRYLVERDLKEVYYGTVACVENAIGNNGRVASWYKYPPNYAGLTGMDDSTSRGQTQDVNWGAYGAALTSDSGMQIDGHEETTIYCWLNPSDFKLRIDVNSPVQEVNKYMLWRFVILDGKRIVQAKGFVEPELTSHPAQKVRIPYYIGFLKLDDMGPAQRSIGELLIPFQVFSSFLMNSHVAETRSKIWGIQGYDPAMFDMAGIQPGTTVARIPSKQPGRDVRSGLVTLSGDVKAGLDPLEAMNNLFGIIQKFFPSQALPSQIAQMDRAVVSQVQAVLQGVNRRLHMMVRTVDDDILGPARMKAYVNISQFEATNVPLAGLEDEDVERILGSGIAQLNREAAAQAIQQLLFALIQSPQNAQQIDIVQLMNYWSSLINVTVDLSDFLKAAPVQPQATAPGPGQNGQQSGPAGVDPNAAGSPVA